MRIPHESPRFTFTVEYDNGVKFNIEASTHREAYLKEVRLRPSNATDNFRIVLIREHDHAP